VGQAPLEQPAPVKKAGTVIVRPWVTARAHRLNTNGAWRPRFPASSVWEDTEQQGELTNGFLDGRQWTEMERGNTGLGGAMVTFHEAKAGAESLAAARQQTASTAAATASAGVSTISARSDPKAASQGS